jgi:hypothetical protein
MFKRWKIKNWYILLLYNEILVIFFNFFVNMLIFNLMVSIFNFHILRLLLIFIDKVLLGFDFFNIV